MRHSPGFRSRPHLRHRAPPSSPGSLILLLLLASCEPAGPVDERAAPPTQDTAIEAVEAAPPVLVDSGIPPAVAGEDGWMYSQSVEADLDRDGEAERVVLTARAEVIRGRPLWDDGQPWQVYVEEPGGTRTYLYARFVQLGTVEMRIGEEEGGRGPTVVLLEHVPHRLGVYELEYGGPGEVEQVRVFERLLDPSGEVSSPNLP